MIETSLVSYELERALVLLNRLKVQTDVYHTGLPCSAGLVNYAASQCQYHSGVSSVYLAVLYSRALAIPYNLLTA